ncbi:MAG TPA: hypothetical protein VN894_02100 [Polyangiaceae bacterium]|nr:hypothetical protein [Polyangiaceae bacterium]
MRSLIGLVLVSAIGCGGTEQPPKQAEPARQAPQKAVPLFAKTSQELGGVDPKAVKRAFSALNDKYMDCQKRALDRIELVAGNVKFFLRIATDGSAKWAYLEESEIGDRDTEKCLIDVVMGARWPKPDAGDAEVRYAMELPLQAARPPSDWSPDKVAGALGKNGDAIDKCKAGAGTTFQATMYVGPGGKVLSAGVAMSSKDAEENANCLAKALVKMKGLPSPGSWPAKVTFPL